MEHIRGAPRHQQTQGKAERRRRAPKNRIPLGIHRPPGGLKARIEAFVDRRNHRRRQGSLDDPAPADVHAGRGQAILTERGRTKRRTVQQRRSLRQRRPA